MGCKYQQTSELYLLGVGRGLSSTPRKTYSILVDNYLHKNSHSEDAGKRTNILLYSEAGPLPGE